MYKLKRIISYIFLFISSFFIFKFNVFAYDQIVIDNLTYYNYLNFYNLEFSDNPIAQKFIGFFKNIDWDLANFIKINRPDSSYLFDNPYIISFNAHYTSNENNEYLFYSTNDNIYALEFSVCTFESDFKGLEYTFDTYNLKIKRVSNSDNCKYSEKFRLYYHSDTDLFTINDYYIGVGSFNWSNFEFGRAISQVFGAVFQTNFMISPNMNVLNGPVMLIGSKLLNEQDFKSIENRTFLGSNWFIEHLFLGGGNVLYSGYSYFTGLFNYGIPYTSDYDTFYIDGLTSCILKPMQPYYDNLNIVKTNNYDRLFFKYDNPSLSQISDELNIFKFHDKSDISSYFKEEDLDIDVIYTFKNSNNVNSVSSDLFTYSYPDDIEVIRLNFSYNKYRAGNALIGYYNKNYFNKVCFPTLSTSEASIYDSFSGDTWFFNVGGIEQNQSILDVILDAIGNFLDLIIESLISIKNAFSKLLNSLLSLLTYLFDMVGNILQFNVIFSFVGSVLVSFFGAMPNSVNIFFQVIFYLSILAIILKILL